MACKVGFASSRKGLVYPLVQGARIVPQLRGVRAELFEKADGVELAVDERVVCIGQNVKNSSRRRWFS